MAHVKEYPLPPPLSPSRISAQPRAFDFLWQNLSVFFQCDDFFEEVSKLPTNKDLASVTVPFPLCYDDILQHLARAAKW